MKNNFNIKEIKMRNILKIVMMLMLLTLLSGCGNLFDSSSNRDSNYGSITVTPGNVTLIRGMTQQFTASESGVRWSIEGNTGNSSIIISSGILAVGDDEVAGTVITVKAEKNNYTTGTAKVTVSSMPPIVVISPSSAIVIRGETKQFTVNQSSGVTWALEGSSGNSSINPSGLLSVGVNESASTLTVKAMKTNYETGIVIVTVQNPPQTPRGFKVSRPSSASIQLSWDALTGITGYTVYRSVNGKDFAQIGTSSGTSYTDSAVGAGSSYYYKIGATGGNDSNLQFTFAADYFNMPTFSQKKLIPLTGRSNHYYRFAVTQGGSYTIEWQNGNNQNINWSMLVDAYQNDGTSIFSGAYNGYTGPKVFTATATGFVTVRVRSDSDNNQDYQIYCYGISDVTDTGTVALPPYKVSAFSVSVPSTSSITLTWDSVSDAVKYNIYRANTQTGTPGKIGDSTTTSYVDNQVPSNGSFWYTIAAVNAEGREGCRFQGAFSFAASHYTLSIYNSTQTLSLIGRSTHYYRLSVTQGASYTIEWQNGNNQNINWNMLVDAYQNDGTTIFSGSYNGYTGPKVFTATATGFVTVRVRSDTDNAQNYQIYYY